jgi:hypothetical protein
MAKEASKAAITRDPILVDLALQGGGSHGAFTWGGFVANSHSQDPELNSADRRSNPHRF